MAAGPAAVTGRAVQQAAGVSSGTFFHYFPTVDDLLLAIALRAAGRQPLIFGDPAEVGVMDVLDRLFDPTRRDAILPWLRQRAMASPSLRNALRRYDTEVTQRFATAVRGAGASEAVDIEAAVEVVRALAEGYQLRLCSDTLGVDPSRFARAAVDLIVHAALPSASRS